MRVPDSLSNAFNAQFEELIGQFATEMGLISQPGDLQSTRFLSRSIVPHAKKLSALFNRMTEDTDLDRYWKATSSPANLRLTYFLYFMPSNLFRIASVWSELSRLGYRWPKETPLRAIEFGAGPASGACGIAAGEHFAPVGLPKAGSWALLEQDKAMLELGASWASRYFSSQNISKDIADWGVRTFHRKLDLKNGFLPRTAPKFNLWIMSYFLNELSEDPQSIARELLASWERHLDDEGIVIIVEPALKAQSRKLLEVRKALLNESALRKADGLQILLPCLGHQACGALATADDWCHEEVSWWRPPYYKIIDKMAGLDRKTLPFSYLVLIRSRRTRQEILPALTHQSLARLVSPAHREGHDLEFFLCTQDGKKRARYKPRPEELARDLNRGDILMDAKVRGESNASRIDKIARMI